MVVVGAAAAVAVVVVVAAVLVSVVQEVEPYRRHYNPIGQATNNLLATYSVIGSKSDLGEYAWGNFKGTIPCAGTQGHIITEMVVYQD